MWKIFLVPHLIGKKWICLILFHLSQESKCSSALSFTHSHTQGPLASACPAPGVVPVLQMALVEDEVPVPAVKCERQLVPKLLSDQPH